MAESMSNEGGLSLPGDILSLALQQTGVESLAPPKLSMVDSSSILSAAAATINANLLSSDVKDLTEGLLTSLSTAKASPVASSAGNLSHATQGQWTYAQDSGIHRSVSEPVPFMDLGPISMDSISGAGGLSHNSVGSDISDLEMLDFNDLLCGDTGMESLVPAPPVSNPNVGNSVPIPHNSGTNLGQDPFQSVLPSYSSSSPLDDELSSLLNATGTEYLESLSQEMEPLVPQVPAPPYTPYTTISQPAVTNGLPNPSATYPPSYPALSCTPTPPALSSHHYRHVAPPINGLPRAQVFNTSVASSPALTIPSVPMIARPPSVPAGRVVPPKSHVTPKEEQPDEDSDDEEEQFSAADTYANYKPSRLKLGLPHPDPVVESSSLSSVEPPQVWFDLKLPPAVIDEGWLSSLQLEAVVYASQQHMNILSDGTRAGFLIGDGAGVGKGRTVAGIIFQNYLEGRKKALWLSVSNDLKYDAMRDLRDVGAKKIKVYSLNKFHYGKISGKRNGRVRKGVIFATYSSLIGESSSGGKYRTRLNQVLHWLGSRYEGVIVLDECHKAKNLVPTGCSKPSKTGLTVLQLQKKLPKARIVYCSATGASEPRNMAYMSRLGIWGAGTQFATFQDFIKAVERRGVGAMEIVAMDMKLRGMYMARQLSFSGVTFSINEVPLAEKVIEMYDASVELWVEARKLFAEAADLLDYDRKKLKTMWGQFWAAHQRFFKYLCIAAKVPETIRVAKKALEEGKCVVIGLQSTGEARTLEQLEQADGELSGFVSTAKGVVDSLIQRHFPTPTSGIDWSLFDGDRTLPGSCRKRRRARGGRRVGTSPRCRASSGVRGERHAPLFRDESFSSEDEGTSSGGPEASDSAVESSSESEDTSEDGSSDSDDDSHGEAPFGINESWAKRDKPKTKRRKTSPTSSPSSAVQGKSKPRNFSIQPPPNSSSRGRGARTKTGFNSRSLKFEPVCSPQEPPKNCLPERRQSIATPEGISAAAMGRAGGTLGPHSPLVTERKPSLQLSMSSVGDGQTLLDLMSNSAMTTGSQSGLRNVTVRKMKEQLLAKLALLAPHLPTNTLDELIDGLGGPARVAEMTGRRGRVVSLSNGSVQYQLRSETDISLEMLNIAEKQRFMDGEKSIAIISEAASSGISLQADRRVKNHKRRVHITLELPWSADKAIQQFGRTHRSNQVSAPEYIFLISALSGEQRFASIVAKRLESLGALTHGDRRANETQDLSKFNFDTKYGRTALETVLKSTVGMTQPQTKSGNYPPDFFDKCRTALLNVDLITKDERGLLSVDKESTNMTRFLNRILGLPVKLQNHLFAYFIDTLASTIQHAKKTGRYDSGIFDFGASGEHVEVAETQEFVGDPAFGTATTQLHRVHVERGLSFAEALEKLNTDTLPGEGLYLSNRVRSGKQVAALVKVANASANRFMIYRPNTGLQSRSEKLSVFQKKYTKVEPEVAEKWWVMQYESSLSVCNHAFWQGKCRHAMASHQCHAGLRRRAYHILSGSVLGVFSQLEGVFSRHGGSNSRMQIARVRVPNKRLVGILIPTACVEDMKQTLSRVALQAAGGVVDNPITV